MPRPDRPPAEAVEPRAPRSDQRRNDRRILQAAARLLAVNPDATVQAIADAAGVTRLTVYRRYPNREAMAAGLRAAVEADAMATLDAFGGWAGGVDAFRALVAGLVALVGRYPVVLVDHRPEPGPGGSPFDRRLVELLAAGQAAGVLRPDVPAESLNAVLFGVLAAFGRVHRGSAEPLPADTIVAVLLDGVGRA